MAAGTPIELRVDTSRVEAAFRMYPKETRKAIVGAVNETLKETRTRIASEIYKKINLPSARIKKDIDIEKATAGNLERGMVRIKHSRPVGLRSFGARQTAKGVTYQIERGGTRKLLPRAFIQTAKGAEHVFVRYFKPGSKELVGRYPLRRAIGISVKEAFVRSGMFEPTVEWTQQTFVKNLNQQLDFRIGGLSPQRQAA